MKTILTALLLTSTLAFAGVHDACHSDNHDSRVFAVAYVGGILDIKRDAVVDGKPVYQMPAHNYDLTHRTLSCETHTRNTPESFGILTSHMM
jgi:hypothetical protein